VEGFASSKAMTIGPASARAGHYPGSMSEPTMQELFVGSLMARLPTGAGGTVGEVGEPFIANAVALNGRGRLLQLIPLASRAWTGWIASTLATVGLTDLARVVQRQTILDDDSAALAASLIPEYSAQVSAVPSASAPGFDQLQASTLAALRSAEKLLYLLSNEPPGLGQIEPEAFQDAVLAAAMVLLSVWKMGAIDLPEQTRFALSEASTGGAVRMAV
jgi:hypothetical protein